VGVLPAQLAAACAEPVDRARRREKPLPGAWLPASL